jgi:hypothetical protein
MEGVETIYGEKMSPSIYKQYLDYCFKQNNFDVKALQSLREIYAKYKESYTLTISQLVEKDQDLFDKCANLIKEYIDSDCLTIVDYCKKFFVTEEDFKQAVSIVRKLDKDLLVLYKDAEKEKAKLIEEKKISELKNVAMKIASDVVLKDGTTRSYDIIDFFQDTNYPLGSLNKVGRGMISIQEQAKVRTFIDANICGDPLTEQSINRCIEMKTEYNCDLDENGNQIMGTGIIITANEKRTLVNYLKHIGVPITTKTYAAIIRRYKEHVIVIQESETLKATITVKEKRKVL